MSAPLTRVDLDGRQCDVTDCTNNHGPMFLHPACHQASGTRDSYENGVLTIACRQCRAVVTRIVVGGAEDAKRVDLDILIEMLARTLAGIEVAIVEPERAPAILRELHDEIARVL